MSTLILKKDCIWSLDDQAFGYCLECDRLQGKWVDRNGNIKDDIPGLMQIVGGNDLIYKQGSCSYHGINYLSSNHVRAI